MDTMAELLHRSAIASVHSATMSRQLALQDAGNGGERFRTACGSIGEKDRGWRRLQKLARGCFVCVAGLWLRQQIASEFHRQTGQCAQYRYKRTLFYQQIGTETTVPCSTLLNLNSRRLMPPAPTPSRLFGRSSFIQDAATKSEVHNRAPGRRKRKCHERG